MVDIEKNPAVKFSWNKVSLYNEFRSFRRFESLPVVVKKQVSDNEQLNEENSKSNAHFGNLSESAKRNLLNVIKKFVWVTYVCNQEKKRKHLKGKRILKFITLTLASAQIHSDTEIKQLMLNQFLTELRQNHGLREYVWKAEKQKNGNIHFHIVIDTYISYKIIRSIWNRIQEKLGYVRRFRENIKSAGFDFYYGRALSYNPTVALETVKKRWQKGLDSDWSEPPGTEIRNIEKVNNVKAYFAKYLSKDDFLDPGFGRIWMASRNLTKDVSVYALPDNEFWSIINQVSKQKSTFYYEHDFCESWYFNCLDLEQFKKNNLAQLVFLAFTNYAFEFW